MTSRFLRIDHQALGLISVIAETHDAQITTQVLKTYYAAAGRQLLAAGLLVHAGEVAESLEVSGFKIRSQIIWAKDRLVLSRGDYHWQHEPCLYAVKKTGKGHWAGDRKQTTLWQIANKDQDADTVHGTQKPVECMRRPILNNSSPGQAVYEPFMGSGTTLIAAETTGRVCYGIELNPAYVDVAVERWQQFTGQAAVLAETGESFADLKSKRQIA